MIIVIIVIIIIVAILGKYEGFLSAGKIINLQQHHYPCNHYDHYDHHDCDYDNYLLFYNRLFGTKLVINHHQ